MAGIDPWDVDDHYLYDHDGRPCPRECPAHVWSQAEIEAFTSEKKKRLVNALLPLLFVFVELVVLWFFGTAFYYAFVR